MLTCQSKEKTVVKKQDTKQNYQKKNNQIPIKLKEQFEDYANLSLDDVRVHYYSNKPVQLQALAYTQGNEIYISSGQEEYLPHELGHVVQQKKGRVSANKSINGFLLNDDPMLEHEADQIAAEAVTPVQKMVTSPLYRREAVSLKPNSSDIVQRAVPSDGNTFPKPIAVLASVYKPQGEDLILTNNKRPSGFHTSTREAVLKFHPHTMIGNRITTVLDASTGQHVNVESIQLDHQISWKHMCDAMINHNRAILEKYAISLPSNSIKYLELEDLDKAINFYKPQMGDFIPNASELYTIADSRRYYNDITNLVPVLGGVNAQAGERGVTTIKPAPIKIENQLGELQLDWMRFQQVLHLLNMDKYNSIGDEVVSMLSSIDKNLCTLLDKLINLLSTPTDTPLIEEKAKLKAVDVGINTILAEASAIKEEKISNKNITSDTPNPTNNLIDTNLNRLKLALEKLEFDQNEKNSAIREGRNIRDFTIEYLTKDQKLIPDQLKGQVIEASQEVNINEFILDINKKQIFQYLLSAGFTSKDFDIMSQICRTNFEM